MLEKIFTSKNRIKIMEYLFFVKNETYIREIGKNLKISPSAVKREVDNLENIGIIKKSSNKIKLNSESNIIDDLKNIFVKTDYISYKIKEILDKTKAKFVFIFGSFAKGTYDSNSDIDLLIIGDFKLSEVYNLLKPVEEKTKREINPVVWTIENLKKEKNSGFVKDIFKKNIIMIKGDENELRKIIG